MKRLFSLLSIIVLTSVISTNTNARESCMESRWCWESCSCFCGYDEPCIYMDCGNGTEMCYEGDGTWLCSEVEECH